MSAKSPITTQHLHWILTFPVGEWTTYFTSKKDDTLGWQSEHKPDLRAFAKILFGLHLRGCATLMQRRVWGAGTQYMIFPFRNITDLDIEVAGKLEREYVWKDTPL
jgi:hypothetical protein